MTKKLAFSIKTLLFFMKKDKKILWLSVFLSMVISTLTIVGAIFSGETIDLFGQYLKDSINTQEILNITYSSLIIMSIYVTFYILYRFVFNKMIKISFRAGSKARKALFENLISTTIGFIEKNKKGDLINKSTTDVDQIIINVTSILAFGLFSPFIILSILIAIFIIAPILALIAITLLTLFHFGTHFIIKKIAPNIESMAKKTGELSAFIEEYTANKEAVYVFGQQKKTIKSFSKINQNYSKAMKISEHQSGMIWPWIDISENITYALIYVIGIVFEIFNIPAFGIESLSIGVVTTFILLLRQGNAEVGNLGRLLPTINRVIASFGRIRDILELTSETNDGTKLVQNLKGIIEFKNVNFSYTPDKAIIKNFSLNIQQGQNVAIVGPTGSGKSTLINLLMRFYEINDGTIKIDGIDIRDFEKSNLRKNISIVLQDTSLFSETIYKNIGYGNVENEIDYEKVKFAAQEIGSNYFINTLPGAFDYKIKNIDQISSGESQLLALTRAYYSPSNILILDEATSSIDSKTENTIQKGLVKLMEGKTTITIAHRLSTIINSDLIIVMKDGEIIEKGSHKDLLSAKGFYYNLYNTNSLNNE